jgi:hydrogenase expression/formation protein HypC
VGESADSFYPNAAMCLGIPGKVVEIYREHDLLMGKVDFGGVLKRVCLEYIPEVAVGEYALVHVGFALTRLDETEAQRVLALLKEAGELAEFEAGGGREVP